MAPRILLASVPLYTWTASSPGAIAIVISMSSATSLLLVLVVPLETFEAVAFGLQCPAA